MNQDMAAAYLVLLDRIRDYMDISCTRVTRLLILQKRQADQIAQMLELMKRVAPQVGGSSFAQETCGLLAQFADSYQDLQDNLRAMASDVENVKKGLQDDRTLIIGE